MLPQITSAADSDLINMARVVATLVDHEDIPDGDREYESAADWPADCDRFVWEPTDPALDADGRLDVAAIAEPYEPTEADWAEANRIHAAMAAERLLGIDLEPIEADRQWWAAESEQLDWLRDFEARERDLQQALLERYARHAAPPDETPRVDWGGHPSEATL